MWMSIGAKKNIVTQKQGDGSFRTYFAVQVAEDFFRNGAADLQDIEATRRLLLSKDFYADWSDEYQDLIRHATDFRSWPLYSLPTESLNWKSVPGLALVGDAAHIAIPNGVGVNCAMTDSSKLASKIAEYGNGDLDQAVREYEAEMFPRGIDSINKGHMMASAMFSEGPQTLLDLMSGDGAPE
jgi:2-polyprenyl-6-methoxyphenol hydroxylase-like FAD-dependent oxidoreductase